MTNRALNRPTQTLAVIASRAKPTVGAVDRSLDSSIDQCPIGVGLTRHTEKPTQKTQHKDSNSKDSVNVLTMLIRTEVRCWLLDANFRWAFLPTA